jgi:UDP-glucose:tetrahydrobiopterin glucosyltransferase
MRIALLAPLVAPIAPPYLGGAQALLADLAAGLAARGHAVTLYAADGSQVPGVETPALGIDASLLRPARFAEAGGDAGGVKASVDAKEEDDEDEADPLAADRDTFLATYAFARAFRAIAAAAERHDLLHAHAYDWPAYAHATLQPLPVVHTLHLPALDPAISAVLARLAPVGQPYAAQSGAPRFVTVSHACAATYANVCRIEAVIYNGLDVERIPFGAHPAADGYLLYAGRIAPEKGVEDALEIARRAGRRLLLAGGVYDRGYYETHLAPRLSEMRDRATYLGPLPREGLWELMAGAAALLAPVRWEEPFGLVACEAQAAGCPVIAYARGGLREVVEDGVTGWLTAPDDIESAVRAVERLAALDRAACRARVARRFGLAAMLAAYEALYAAMLADGEGR